MATGGQLVDVAQRVRDALDAVCHPLGGPRSSVLVMGALAMAIEGVVPPDGVLVASVPTTGVAPEADTFVATMFEAHAAELVRLARLFVDDRNAAEDLVQEAFIRLARSARRIEQPARAAAYLRSIVLNLCRDHNRRGLVSLRHHLPADDVQSTFEDEVVLRDDQREVVDALRALPARQRDCVVLRHYFELGIPEIAETLGVSQNSVKTHLQRGMSALGRVLGADR